MSNRSGKTSLSSIHMALNRYFDALFDSEIGDDNTEEEAACCNMLRSSDYDSQYLLSAYRMQMLNQAVLHDADYTVHSAAQQYYEDKAAPATSVESSSGSSQESEQYLALAHSLRSKSEQLDEERQRYQNRADHAEQLMRKV